METSKPDGDELIRNELLDRIASFVDYIGDTARLRRLTERGMHGLFGSLRLFEMVANEAKDPTAAQVARVDETRLWTAAAQVEIDSDFALLHGHSLMGAWGALESMVEDVAMLWILHADAVQSRPAFSKMKVTIANFLRLDDREQAAFLVGELQRSTASDLKPGVGQFEAVLDDIGLGGSVDAGVRRALYYGQQLRNLVAHRGSVADRRFLEACPNLSYKINDKVRVSTAQFVDVTNSMQAYAVTLADRVCFAFGLKATGATVPGSPGATFLPAADNKSAGGVAAP